MTYDDVKRVFHNVHDVLYSEMQRTFSGYRAFQEAPPEISAAGKRDRIFSESEVEKRKAEIERHRLCWTHIHPDHWSTVEVASFLNSIADEHSFSQDERSNTTEAFQSMNGSQLISMTKEEFLMTDQFKGGLIFEILKNMYPVGLTSATEESKSKDFMYLLPPISEDSGSASSRDTSPAARRKSSSI